MRPALWSVLAEANTGVLISPFPATEELTEGSRNRISCKSLVNLHATKIDKEEDFPFSITAFAFTQSLFTSRVDYTQITL